MKEAEGLDFDQALTDTRTKGMFQTERHGPDGNVEMLTHRPSRAVEMARWDPEKAEQLESQGVDCLIALEERRVYTNGGVRIEAGKPLNACGCSDDNQDCKCMDLSLGIVRPEGLIPDDHPDREDHRRATVCGDRTTKVSDDYRDALTNHNWQAVQTEPAAGSAENVYRCRDCQATLEVREHLIPVGIMYTFENIITCGTVTKAGVDIQARWLMGDLPDDQMTPCTTSQWKAVLRAENRHR